MSDQNQEVVRACWEVANGHDASAFKNYYDKDVVYHGGAEEIRGVENVTAYLQGYLTAFPDMKLTIEDIFSNGDKVFSRVRAEGTNTGEIMGMPPTGRHMEIRWIMNEARVVNGRIVEEWEIVDELEIMRQLGVVETPAASRTT
jgi:steroid delta-isomerase-like uncharacterized protein